MSIYIERNDEDSVGRFQLCFFQFNQLKICSISDTQFFFPQKNLSDYVILFWVPRHSIQLSQNFNFNLISG